jgi:hypothetical protein
MVLRSIADISKILTIIKSYKLFILFLIKMLKFSTMKLSKAINRTSFRYFQRHTPHTPLSNQVIWRKSGLVYDSSPLWLRNAKKTQCSDVKNRRSVQTSDDPFGRQYADEVRIKEQTVKCIIGCNPDERDRLQDLVLTVRLWTNLHDSMSKFVKNCDVLEGQKIRADSTDWASHAAAELAGTYDYSAGVP